MRTLIIPCAGKSSRFNPGLPKYLLEHPSGNMMVYESIQGLPLDTFDKILLIVQKSHMINGDMDKLLSQFQKYEQFDILCLDRETSSSSETVSIGIIEKNITGEIYIKDPDDYFYVSSVEPNEICTYSLNKIENVTPGNKSYIRKNRHDEVLTIIEKCVISSDFCCGLYSFESAEEFVDAFYKIKRLTDNEIYVSNVIFKMILEGKIFFERETEDFIDWGTQKDWDYFKNNYKK